jgi:hypothetical protein
MFSILARGEEDDGGGEISYDGEKAWSSINHSVPCSHLSLQEE